MLLPAAEKTPAAESAVIVSSPVIMRRLGADGVWQEIRDEETTKPFTRSSRSSSAGSAAISPVPSLPALLTNAVDRNDAPLLRRIFVEQQVNPDMLMPHQQHCGCSTSPAATHSHYLLTYIIHRAPADNPDLLAPLLERNVRLDTIEPPYANTPLIETIRRRKPEMALALLAAEAERAKSGFAGSSSLLVSYNSPEKGTALIYAVDRLHPRVVTALCKHPKVKSFINLQLNESADYGRYTEHGRTALLAALSHAYNHQCIDPAGFSLAHPVADMVQQLVAAGADPRIDCQIRGQHYDALSFAKKRSLDLLLPSLTRALLAAPLVTPASTAPVPGRPARVTPVGEARIVRRDTPNCCVVQ